MLWAHCGGDYATHAMFLFTADFGIEIAEMLCQKDASLGDGQKRGDAGEPDIFAG